MQIATAKLNMIPPAKYELNTHFYLDSLCPKDMYTVFVPWFIAVS